MMNQTKKHTTSKKLLALLLALIMTVSLLPMSVFAAAVDDEAQIINQAVIDLTNGQSEYDVDNAEVDAEPEADVDAQAAKDGTAVQTDDGVTTVIACSDFQHPSGDAGGAKIVTNILNAMKGDVTTADGFICAGDYSYGYSYDASTLSGHLNSLKKAVEGVYGTSLNEVYVQGNHEQNSQGTGGLTGPGAHDTANYGVFVIDEDDYMWYNNDEARVKQTAEKLAAYLAAKVAAKDSRPIFVVSHLPLHYSMRTLRDGDGQYANYIFDVLNAAGENGLNIIFMYGHNHSHGWDDYLGGSRVYLAKGDQIVIGQGSKTSHAIKTLNFTYLNAGYTGYYSYNGEDKIDDAMGDSAPLTMTMFRITDSQVTVSRYGRNGKEALKNAGQSKCDYFNATEEAANGCPVNSTYYNATPQNITLTEVRDVAALTINGTPVSKYAVDRATVQELVVGLQNFDGYTTSWGSSNERIAAVNDGTVSFPGETGKVTITATGTPATRASGDSISASLVLTVTDSSVTPTERTYTRVTSADELESGKQYLLIYNSSTDYFMQPVVKTQERRTGFTIIQTDVAGADTITGTDYIDYEWTLTKSGNGWLLGKESSYAKLTDTGINNQKVKATLESGGDTFTIGGTENNYTFSNGDYYLNYNDGGKLINGYDGNPAVFYIYKLTSEGTDPVDPGTETERSKTLYVGQSWTDTISGEYNTTASNSNPDAVTVTVTGKEEQSGTTSYTPTSLTINSSTGLAWDGNWTATEYYHKVGNNYYPVYMRYYYSDSSYWGCYQIAYNNGSYQTLASGWNSASADVYTKVDNPATPASTTVKFQAKAAGVAVIKVGSVTYTITVKDKAALNNYPEYPDEGAVRVEKTGTGIDFQNTGVAKIDLSTTGIPMSKGVDVILMLDTSSSMNDTVDGQTRIQVLRDSVANMLATFNTPDKTTGKVPDIRVAIADFNGYYYSDSAVALDSADHLTGGSIRSDSPSDARVYTGTGSTYTSGAFVEASTYNTAAKRTALVNTISTASGTNYDAAFYYSYQLGEAINAKNMENDVERDLYVVFMSDGAPFQYNGFSSQSGEANGMTAARLWNNWLQGTANNAASNSHSYFYNTDGNKNWWAEAIKGDTNSMYTVIDKTSNDNYDGNQYMARVSGLGAKMYAIGFCLAVDKEITVASMENVLNKAATDSSYYFKADSASDLNSAFTQIASNIKKAGYAATFTDVMGDAYDLQITPIKKQDGTLVANPTITVSTYQLWKRSDYEAKACTLNQIGTRKSDIPFIQETVTFNAAGTEAYSDKIGNGTTNILTNNKINAKLFTYDFGKETFSWNVGDITEDEQVLSYYVYLTGSMEGKRGAGSYPTNESAVLNYKNWLGNDAHKDTVSPVMPWESANVSYAFYLVDANGNPVTNQTTGATGSFADAVKVTQPVVHQEVLLNSGAEVDATVVASNALPDGYKLYDEAATYTVRVRSGDGTGSWTITNGQNTTYVMQYDTNNSAAFTNEVDSNNVNGGKNDYTHTVVWFAVKYQISCVPDTVVIDFGLPVDISVLGNDILGDGAKVAGLAKVVPVAPSTSTLADGFISTGKFEGYYGTAEINGTKVRYTPSNMKMDGAEKFAYAAQAALANDTKYYYSTVTVIPAANIYYEDSFVTFNNNGGEWKVVGETKDGITQQEDRPGKFSLKAYDANNVYGYDEAYKTCSAYSLGSAKKVTVNSETNKNAPTATFTFKGTGFDLISLTSNTTGTILVNVKGTTAVGAPVAENWIVDTYYGYTRTENGYLKYTWTLDDNNNWHATKEVVQELPSDADIGGTPEKSGDTTYAINYEWTVTTGDNALYQIPVIRGQGLEYGTYTVTITPRYSSARNHANKGSYEFYLDAVRIYDPAGTNPASEISDAYKADGEGWPDVIELRNELIDADSLNIDTELAKGIVFVDGAAQAGLTDYVNYGPNNEVYLAAGQAIAFKLNVADAQNIASIQLAAKAPKGTAIAKVNSDGTDTTIATATEMYYTITHRVTWSNNNTSNTIVVANVGDNILSLTNLKITYKEAPNSSAATQVDAQVLEEAPDMLLSMLGIEAPVVEPEPAVFEPERFEASWNRSSVKAGEKATLTVKTTEDVAAITVDGVTIDTYRTRTQRTGWGWNAKKVTYREFTYTITASETADHEITAVNAEGTASEAITATLTVRAAAQRPGIGGWLNKLFSRWF